MKLVSSPTFLKMSEVEKNQVIFERAQYLETRENTMSKFAGSLNHFFELEDGSRLGVGGNVKLNDVINTNLIEGDFCKLVYKGKSKSKSGNEYNDWDLYIEENKPLKKVAEKSTNLNDLE